MKLLQRILLALLLLGSSVSLSLGIELMLSGAHHFLDRKLAETLVRRSNHWEKGLSSPKNQ